MLANFDPKADHIIQVDGSIKGLGAVLLQEGRSAIYASRTLTPGETGYFNIKRELLSLVVGLERIHHFVLGSKVKVKPGHKPLTPVWKKSFAVASPHHQHLILRLVKEDVELSYLKGEDNAIADALHQVSPLTPKPEDKTTLV